MNGYQIGLINGDWYNDAVKYNLFCAYNTIGSDSFKSMIIS